MNNVPTTLNASVRVLQIILLALLFGVLAFAGFVLLKRWQEPVGQQPFGQNPLDWVVSLGVPFQLMASFFVPRQMWLASSAKLVSDTKVSDEQLPPRIMQIMQVSSIVGAALVESACLLVLMLLLMGGHPLFWVLVGLGVLALVIRIPSTAGVTNTINDQVQLIQSERQFAPTSRT